jgi:hypothetical protein
VEDPMTIETPEQSEPTPFDQEKEMRNQTELLKSINGKLGFFVFVLVITIILQVAGFFMSF